MCSGRASLGTRRSITCHCDLLHTAVGDAVGEAAGEGVGLPPPLPPLLPSADAPLATQLEPLAVCTLLKPCKRTANIV